MASNQQGGASQQASNVMVPAGVNEHEIRLPSAHTLLQAAQLAIKMDRAIMLDYYMDTFTGKAVIGEDQDPTKEPKDRDKILLKSNKDCTSIIQKILKAGNGEDLIVLTENSIYIISSKVQKRRIQASHFLDNDD